MTLFKERYRIESTRLPQLDYTEAGWYFVTICTKNRVCCFGEIDCGQMRVSALGKKVTECWNEVPLHHAHVATDGFVVMPNHVHGIIVLQPPARTTLQARTTETSKSPLPSSVGAVVRSFKSAVTRWSNQNGYAFAWQPRYFEHVIRNPESLGSIREYIRDNPLNWEFDSNNPGLVPEG